MSSFHFPSSEKVLLDSKSLLPLAYGKALSMLQIANFFCQEKRIFQLTANYSFDGRLRVFQIIWSHIVCEVENVTVEPFI